MRPPSGRPLSGIRIIELAGIGPGPFCGMMLGDMGADVIRVDRPGGNPMSTGTHDVLFRNRRSIAVDLKNPAGRDAVLRMCSSAEALFEGFRPGVAERLGIGPDTCLARNPALVYGRMSGWGQEGPLAEAAGHDINYISLSGALHAIGRADDKPVPPLNLVGDFGGGGLMLAFGMVCALLEARRSGKGQVVDASMVEGSAALMAMFFGLRSRGDHNTQRGRNLLDGGAPFYDTYETRDGRYISIASIEPQFYALLCDKLSLPRPLFDQQMARERWPEQRRHLETLFRSRTREEWCRLLEGSDICFAPVLELDEVAAHPHNRVRNSIINAGGLRQPAPAPRFSRTVVHEVEPVPCSPPGTHTVASLRGFGFSDADIGDLLAAKAVVQL